DHDGGNCDYQHVKEDAECINAHHAEPAGALRGGLINRSADSQKGADEGEPSQGTAIIAGGQQWVDQHQESAENAEDNLRKNLNVIEFLVHRLVELACKAALVPVDL